MLLIVLRASPGHTVLLILAHIAGASLGEEMGGPPPYSPAPLTPLTVQPGF